MSMSKRRRIMLTNSVDEGEPMVLEKCESLYWSSLPGVPRKVKWPVKVAEWSDNEKPVVYCRSDNAYFKVARDQLVPFPGPFDKLKGRGAAVLTQKKHLSTLTAFHEDIEWALNHDNPDAEEESDDSVPGTTESSDERALNHDNPDAEEESGDFAPGTTESSYKRALNHDNPDAEEESDDFVPGTTESSDERAIDHDTPDTEEESDDFVPGTSESSDERALNHDNPDAEEESDNFVPGTLESSDERALNHDNPDAEVESDNFVPGTTESSDERALNHDNSDAEEESDNFVPGTLESSDERALNHDNPDAEVESDNFVPGTTESSDERALNHDNPDAEEESGDFAPGTTESSDERALHHDNPDAEEESDDFVPGTTESSDERAIDHDNPDAEEESDDFVPGTSESSDESDTDASVHIPYNQDRKQKSENEKSKKFESNSRTDLDSEIELSSNSDSCHSDGNDEIEEEDLLSENGKSKKFESKIIKKKFKLRDVNNSHIYIRKLRTSKYNQLTGIRKKSEFVWNQVHCCKFCKKVTTNIAKHYTSVHKKNKKVVEIVELSKQRGAKDKIVKAKWDILRQEGDHNHNMEVLDSGEGEFIMSRRQHDRLDVSSYGPCPSCLAWLRLEKTLFRHRKTCPAVILGNETTKDVSAAELRIRSLGLAGKLSPKASQALKNEVFPIMTNDNISSVAQDDPLIVALGNLWMSKNIGNRLKRKYYTSSRMRGAARLLIYARQISGHDDYSMNDILVTDHFEDLVKAALRTASQEIDDIEDLRSPSTAIKVGYDIKRMLGAKWAQSLKEKSSEDKREAKDVFKLMEIEWSVRVTKLASTILTVRKFNMEKSLPEPSDLVDLNNHLKEEIKLLVLTNSSPPAFRRACHLVEARLLLYNKRRSGEVEGIRITEYVKRQTGVSNIDKAMRSELSALEKKLLESQDLLETRGKFGRGVPVIIPPDVKDVLQYLTTASIRTSADRLSSNRYLFANTSNGVIRAYDSLKTVCSEVDLLKPDKITSVNLRKYTATISQVFDLNDQQQSWLVNHLGHSMDIHKIHYRQTSGAIERIDISKLMLLQEFNLSSKYAGQQLNDIQLKELLFDVDKGGIVMNDQEELPDEVPVPLQNEDEEYQPGLDRVVDKVFDEFDFTEEDEFHPKKKKSAAASGNRKRWSEIEMDELKTLFKENLDTLTTPGMKACLKAIQSSKKSNGQLCKRTWETIKKKIWNEIQKLKFNC